MATFLLVHGTGVRLPGFDKWLGELESRIARLEGDHSLVFCHWGEGLGANVSGELKSVPSRAGLDGNKDDSEADRWSLLYRDPMFELKVRAVRGLDREWTSSGGFAAINASSSVDLDSWLPSHELVALLDEGQISSVFEEARTFVLNHYCFPNAINGSTNSLTHFREEVARAICAKSILLCHEIGNTPALLAESGLRDRIIQRIIDDLGGTEAAIGEWLGKPFMWMGRQISEQTKQLMTRCGSWWVQGKVEEMYNAHYPKIADILLYQSRGHLIRKLIRKEILGQEDEVVILAHSLGGVAAFEALIDDLKISDDPSPSISQRVSTLVTLGSQTPFFYETNALHTLPFDSDVAEDNRIPQGFPKWINFFDRADFLSFVAEPLFPGRVVDIEIKSKQPFPISHSSYWASSYFWEKINEQVS